MADNVDDHRADVELPQWQFWNKVSNKWEHRGSKLLPVSHIRGWLMRSHGCECLFQKTLARMANGGDMIPTQLPTVIGVFFTQEDFTTLSSLFDVC